ncbi:ECF transporter S component [Levilactobacillus parabrevis]|uniref:ABC-type cobalt transport system, permease component n=1 Tax=Levilactobacillus parabrevis ATCC 53295 TaxID=1267003 RepID=A0A0R1GQ53_9LACO|nr:ECF transporter S component [Levilactobacillus parabrevis]KRK36187.1 ABC-type cobalt transport system, permease component [Levilactobacillus parabrevis ATCC 53295]KRO05578.1 ABC-type cobalt transport system, permease component [Levilactobacillus parabrevis]MCT4486736.1 ABC transporter permease [Levilactobacillus parabrevis]MCT4490450.1 ABC transporter permease [Levilactobacillus parabrevis]
MKRWHIRDIILVTIIAIFMGVIFWAIGPVYTILAAALAPFGLQPLANELLLGIWVMAGPLAGFVIRIPGAATLGELLGAVVEMFLGGIWGASTLISGVLQGFGSELGFIFTGYKRYGWFTLAMSTLTTTIVTFAWDLIRNGYTAYHLPFLLLLFVVRLLSVFVFGGVLTKLINNLLVRAHVLKD